ncbi:WbqC family protein [soil metagenome]
MSTILLSTAYLPPVSYFSRLIVAEKIIFEKHEHYIKQSYRNRALIYGANGIHPLIVPIKHEGIERKSIAERKISYDDPWQKIHWRTITSSYRNSPYFEYFEEEFRPFYETKTETLFEFNLILLKKILALLQIPFEPEFTLSYEESIPSTFLDLRNAFAPSTRKVIPEYNQVFGERFGFISDLSILDLLFSKGMQTKNYLKEI